MTPEATPSIPDEDYLKSLFAGEIEGASVVGMGPDIWDLQRRVVPAIGPGGRYVGVHVDGATVQDARQRSGHNGGVEFHEIEDDLRLSRAVADALIRKHAPSTLAGLQEVEREIARLRAEQPLVADESVDLVLATGLRQLASRPSRSRLLKDFHRVLRRGGRLVVADVVSDEDLASRALAEAGEAELGRSVLRDMELLDSLAEAGFYGVTVLRRDTDPWKLAGAVELRRLAAVGYKGKEGPCFEHFQAVMYRGPFKEVHDDDGHVYARGQQTAVCKKTFDLLSREPYGGQFGYTEPLMPVAPGRAKPFPCDLTSPVRDPRQVKRSLPLRRPAAPAVVAPASPPGAPASAGPEIARTVRETSKSAPTGHRKSLVIYERKTPGQASASEELAHSLRERFATELDVRIVDLDEVAVETEVPSQLRFRMSVSGDRCLPAVALNGVLAAMGRLPGPQDVEKLISQGRRFGTLPFANIESSAAPSDDGGRNR